MARYSVFVFLRSVSVVAGMNETLLEVQYPFGPGTAIAPNSTLSSFRTYTILQDADDLERQSLQRRKMVRALAPQVTENMLMFYCNTGDSATIRRCADQVRRLRLFRRNTTYRF